MYQLMLELEVIEMCGSVLLFGLDLHKSEKGLTSCDAVAVALARYSFFPSVGTRSRLGLMLFPSLNCQFIMGDAI